MVIDKFQKIFELSPDENSLDYKIKAISILTGRTVDEVESLSIDEFKALANKIKIPDLSNKLVFTSKINGIRFDAILNMKEISTAEFLEVSTFTKDEKSIIKNLHKLMAIFYKPQSKWIGLKKVSMKRSEVAEMFREHMDIAIAYPLAVFFLESWKKSTPIILTSLEKKMRETVKMVNAQIDKS